MWSVSLLLRVKLLPSALVYIDTVENHNNKVSNFGHIVGLLQTYSLTRVRVDRENTSWKKDSNDDYCCLSAPFTL